MKVSDGYLPGFQPKMHSTKKKHRLWNKKTLTPLLKMAYGEILHASLHAHIQAGTVRDEYRWATGLMRRVARRAPWLWYSDDRQSSQPHTQWRMREDGGQGKLGVVCLSRYRKRIIFDIFESIAKTKYWLFIDLIGQVKNSQRVLLISEEPLPWWCLCCRAASSAII
jgi:hypothetical protein